jgi:hypothetical protein
MALLAIVRYVSCFSQSRPSSVFHFLRLNELEFCFFFLLHFIHVKKQTAKKRRKETREIKKRSAVEKKEEKTRHL